mgnify:CR=1 FL=1
MAAEILINIRPNETRVAYIESGALKDIDEQLKQTLLTRAENLDALEVTDLEGRRYSTARFFNGSKTEYPRRMHCIQGSDAHRINGDPKNVKRLGIGERATELLLDAPTFEGIKALLQSTQFDRTRPARPA